MTTLTTTLTTTRTGPAGLTLVDALPVRGPDEGTTRTRPVARADWTDWAMPCSIAIHGPEDLLVDAVRRTRRFLARVGGAASGFDPGSEISYVNDAAGTPVRVSPLAAELIGVALRAAAASDGAVDPTVADDLLEAVRAVVRQHRSGQPEYVTCPELDRDRRPDWRSVRLDTDAGTVTTPAGCRLDLHATTGAWAADAAARSLAQATGRSVLVGIGGDLACAGPPYPWRVRVGELIGDPDADSDGGRRQRITLHRGGLATSTAYASPDPGDRLSRLPPMPRVIDPRTGQAVASGRRSVTVAAASAVQAQVAALTGLVRGPEALARLLGRNGAARVAGDDGISPIGGWPLA